MALLGEGVIVTLELSVALDVSPPAYLRNFNDNDEFQGLKA
jgi:hypothetical protein